MFRRSTLLLTAAAGASAVVFTAGPALAANTYTVKAGTQTTGTTTYTAATTGGTPQISFSDTTTGLALGCDSGTATGGVKLGSGLAGKGLGSITGTTWTNCIGPVNLKLNVTQVGTWNIDASGLTTAKGVTAGKVTNVVANIADSSGACSFTVTGAVKASLTTTATKQTLTVKAPGSTLKISNVAGCFGQVNNGDGASFAAVYAITAAAGKLAISNP